MDLQVFFLTLIRHRRLLALGAFLGLIALVLSLYTVTFKFQGFDQPPLSFNKRSDRYYETTINLAVDSPKFGMGRAGLAPDSWPAFSRSLDLAPTYSYLIVSDFMLDRIEDRVGPLLDTEYIESEVIQDTPIFTLKVRGKNQERIQIIAMGAVKELREYIKRTQLNEETPQNDTIMIRVLGEPSKPVEADRFRLAKLSLALLSPIFLAMVMAFIIENIEGPGTSIKMGRGRRAIGGKHLSGR